jgi:hypothetical protein
MPVMMKQTVQGEYATLAIVLRTQHESRVLDGNDQRERPDTSEIPPSTFCAVSATPPWARNNWSSA